MNTQTVRNSIIDALVHFDGYGAIFPRVLSELQRIDKAMPHATGAEKLAKFEADAVVIFEDGILPVGSYLCNALLNLGLIYLKGVNPVAGAVVSTAAPSIMSDIESTLVSK